MLELLLINHPLDCDLAGSAISRANASCRITPTRKGGGRRATARPKRVNPVEDFGGDVVVRAWQSLHPVYAALRAVHGDDVVHEDPVLNVKAIAGITP